MAKNTGKVGTLNGLQPLESNDLKTLCREIHEDLLIVFFTIIIY